MKNFKEGQEVVYDDKGNPPISVLQRTLTKNIPKNGEIVKLKSRCFKDPECWDIFGYEMGKDGVLQSFNERLLHPLEDYFKEQTESIVNKIEESNKQPELV